MIFEAVILEVNVLNLSSMFKSALSAAICWIVVEGFVGYFIIPPINPTLIITTVIVGIGAYSIGSNLETIYNRLEFRTTEGLIMFRFWKVQIELSRYNATYICFGGIALPLNTLTVNIVGTLGIYMAVISVVLLAFGFFQISETFVAGLVGMVISAVLCFLSLGVNVLFSEG